MRMVILVFEPTVKTFYTQFHVIPLESSKGREHLRNQKAVHFGCINQLISNHFFLILQKLF